MKKLVHRSFLKRNSRRGVERYLSKLGFDVSGGYEVEDSDRRDFVYLVTQDLRGVEVGELESDVEVVEQEPTSIGILELIREVGGIPEHVADILIEAGYDTVGRIMLATDVELLEIDGIGSGRLRAIRAILDRI